MRRLRRWGVIKWLMLIIKMILLKHVALIVFEGRFYSFSPKTYLDRMDLTVIRPMMFIDEMEVIGFRNKYSLPVVKRKMSCRRTYEAAICKRTFKRT